VGIKVPRSCPLPTEGDTLPPSMLESYKPLLDRLAHSAVELSTKFTWDKEAKPGIKAICRLITSFGES
jgi:hypothetical protein